MLEVLDVLYLAWLCHSVSIFLEAPPRVEAHHIAVVLIDAHEEEETANDGTSPSLAVIAVKNSDSLGICAEELRHNIADSEEHVERRRFVVFPIKADNIF